MDKVYQHQSVEQQWYTQWETAGYFTPEQDLAKKPFTIILPPPNANADLHVGHAMFTVEDIMIRYHRMKGEASLWLAGADHAGFETQFVFEKHLAKEGKSRFDYPREELYQMIWDFVQKNKGMMENQLRRLGFSLDWTRNTFTLDPKIVAIVYKTFKQLHTDGLVYRGERLVNYCTKCGTGFSDLEVVSTETQGSLYHIRFPFTDGGHITIATTRPETMLGDVAVMVHPKDKRYQKYIGKQVKLPLTDRTIPVIADAYVDKTFGTGAVKVTPAHDFNDYEIAKKHGLTFPPVIGFNGKMQNTGVVDGLRVKAAREEVIKKLQEQGLLEKIEPHQMTVKTCYKCGSVLEPLPLPQWYVKVKPLTEKAVTAIKKKQVAIVPKRFEKVAVRWLTEFHDWNISRQIVWGIRIPAWKCVDCSTDSNPERSEGSRGLTDPQRDSSGLALRMTGGEYWIVTDGEIPTECPHCKGTHLDQDTDTFDTWFSSSQWPFATLKANQSGDFEYFYPTTVMETGYDILPVWVCRMLMLGMYATQQVPFQTVCLHGLVRDAKGQKMSKSKGNVINPITMIDQYGADSLRMALIYGAKLGNDIALSEDKIRGMRNFSNKLWNIGRFIKMNQEAIAAAGVSIPAFDREALEDKLQAKDKRTLTQLGMVIQGVTKELEAYQFGQAAERLYGFIWHTIADKYIEHIKDRLKANDATALSVLHHVYLTSLTLLHPFMPFISEELVKQLDAKHQPLIISEWPH